MSVRVVHYTKVIKRNIVLDDVTVDFNDKTLYCIRGENGSGKTMLLKALSGLMKPTSGHVEVDGLILRKEIEFPPSIGLLIESPSFINHYTGLQNLLMLASIKGIASHDAVCDALDAMGLDPADARKYSKYSLGMKERLGIACAIMEKPDIVLLDEPMNALDKNGTKLLISLLRDIKKHTLIIVATHDSGELAELEDVTINMEQGKIISINSKSELTR